MAIKIPIVTVFDNKGLRNAQSQVQKFGAAIKTGLKVAALAAAAAVAVAAVGAKFAKMAEEAQVANNRLDQIAASMGIFGKETGAVTDRLKAYADQNKFVLGVDDEVIKSTQAKLLTFKDLATTADEAGGAFDRATQAAFDMAAAGFGSAETNAVQLGKALQDPIKGLTSLARAGVTFTAAEKEQIKTLVESGKTLQAQEMILASIESQVGGTAAATATATSKMSVAFGEIGEAIGTAVLPMIESFSNYLVEITPQIESFFADLTDPTTEVGEAWFEMSSSVMAFGDTIAGVWSQIDSTGIFTNLLKGVETIMVGLSQLVWIAGDAGKTLGMLFSGDFAGAGAQVSSFFTRYNGFVDQLYAKIDNGAAALAASAQKRFQGNDGGNKDINDIRNKITGPGATAQAQSIGQILKREGAIATKEAKLLSLGVSEGLASKIVSTAKTPKALTKQIKDLKKGGDAAVKDLQNKFNKTKAGQKEVAAAAAEAAAAAAQAAQELAAAQAAAAESEANALAERERVYNSFLDSVKSTFASIKESILGAFDLSQLGGSTNAITRNMDKLLVRLRAFAGNVKQLSSMGLNPALLQQVISAGPMAGARLAESLVMGGTGALAAINAGYNEFGVLSGQIAQTGTESLFGTQAQTNQYVINVDGGVGSGATIGKAIVDAIKAYERTSGAVWQGA
jgi:hypothetical protein